jgi:hypothetical protein
MPRSLLWDLVAIVFCIVNFLMFVVSQILMPTIKLQISVHYTITYML